MRLFLYSNEGKPQKEFALTPGEHLLGISSAHEFVELQSPEAGKALLKIEVIEDDSGVIVDCGCADGLLLNEKKVSRAHMKAGDEIVADNHLLVCEEKKVLRNYVFVPEERKEPVVLTDDAGNVTIAWMLSSAEVLDPSALPASGSAYTLEKSHKQLLSLLTISQEVNSTFNLSHLLEKIVDYLFQAILIERAIIMLTQGAGQPLPMKVAVRRGLRSDTIPVSRTIVTTVLRDGVSVATANALEDPRFRTKESVVAQQIRSAMCVPLLREGKVMGAIYVDSRNPAVTFEQEDLRFLTILANLTSIAIENATRVNRLELEVTGWREECRPEEYIIGTSPKALELYEFIKRVAGSSVTVLLIGESGTGKEMVARAVHHLSARRERPFVTINCASLSENLLESELFGYEKGAFTGAVRSKPGRFEIASDGTIFLDEIGEISPTFQLKLLRVLEGAGFERVGGIRTITSGARIIAATNKDLEAEVEKGKFRGDLFYRLNVFPIYLPLLCERKEDILILADYFLGKFATENVKPIQGFTEDARAWLLEYDWPGNVRELKNVIERAVLLCDEQFITRTMLSHPCAEEIAGLDIPASKSLWKREEEAIVNALREAGWNKTKAAKILGIARHQLVYRMSKYHIEEVDLDRP
jgi:Nif-specific regulatory protein